MSAYGLDDLRAQTRFGVPLVSHIVGNLWQGGVIHGYPLPGDFRHVISLHPAEKYTLSPRTTRVEYEGLVDGADLPDVTQLEQIVTDLRAALAEGSVLVHCQAGLNRSGLVAALALIRGGWEPAHAITELRKRRHGNVLFNGVFEQWLLTQGGAR